MELVGGGRHGEDGSASGSRVAVLGGFGIRSIGPGHEETSVAAGGDFTESAGDNVDVIDHGCVEGPPVADQDAVFEERTDSGDAVSAQSTGKMDPQAIGWTKRVRLWYHPLDRTPCPERVGALEQTIRGYAGKLGDHVVEPAIGLTFDSLSEAYDIYNLYSWEHGFGIRYGKSRLNAEKTKCMQEVVCGCSGKPTVENSRSCRCECPAMIRSGGLTTCQMNLNSRSAS